MNGSMTDNFGNKEKIDKIEMSKVDISEKGDNSIINEEKINNNLEEMDDIQEDNTSALKETINDIIVNETLNSNNLAITPVIPTIQKALINLKLNYIAEKNLGPNSSKAMLLMLLKKYFLYNLVIFQMIKLE